MKYVLTAVAALALSGCATLIDGTNQQISINTNAPNAKCSVSQNGAEIIPASAAPATHVIARRPGNLIVTCSAPGYETASGALVAGRNPKTVVLSPFVIGLLASGGADSLAGGLVEYQGSGYIYLKRKSIL